MTIVASLAETNYQYSVSIRNTDFQLPGPVSCQLTQIAGLPQTTHTGRQCADTNREAR